MAIMQIYFRDRFIDEHDVKISVNDRSFRFGDGLFETAIIANSRIWDWESHFERLSNGLKFYQIDMDIRPVEKIAGELISKNNIKTGFVRVIISRGEAPGVGYMHDDSKPYMIVQVFEKPLPEFKSIKLIICSHRAFYKTPCKTNNAMLYSLAMLEAQKAGADNALILSHDDYICETSNGNIFWIKGDVLYTPSNDLPFVQGTVRKKVLELWQGEVREGKYKLEDLYDAEEIFMTNVGGIVTKIGEILQNGIMAKNQIKIKAIRDLIMESITSS